MEKEQKNDIPAIPRANVDQDGHCTEPAHAESVRFDTGDACVDGLNWPAAGKDVPISPKDGSLDNKAE